ncbi:MAG TPA: hypothetical protein VF453_17010, partial [Burkholderiaceae bacterium]
MSNKKRLRAAILLLIALMLAAAMFHGEIDGFWHRHQAHPMPPAALASAGAGAGHGATPVATAPLPRDTSAPVAFGAHRVRVAHVKAEGGAGVAA